MAMTGNEKPDMEKDRTPHSDAALRAKRNEGKRP